MLKKITLRNFKSFRDSTFELGPLTLMVGANASGKSNFVDALRFLQGCARSLTVIEILSGKWQGGKLACLPIRGNEQESFNLFHDSKTFEIIIDWELPNLTMTYDVKVKAFNSKIAFTQERWLADGERYDSPIDQNIGDYDVSNFDFLVALPDAPENVRKSARILRDWLNGLYFLEPNPSAMRNFVSKLHTRIGTHGENLSSVLFNLASDTKQRQTILDWIQELCTQEISDLHFYGTELGDEVLLAIKEPNGTIISARSMSDGTLRFLAIIVAMLAAKEGTTFIIEEIDNNLHPSRLHLLVSFLEQVTASRKLQVIASTHSPYFFDHLSEDSLKNVLVFHRDQQSAETKVAKLVDIPGFAEARKNMPLDLMHASSWMEQNL
jgi:predicted ATPase